VIFPLEIAVTTMANTETHTELLSYARAEIRAEIGLLNDRLNALMSPQSFLVIAYSSSLNPSLQPLFSKGLQRYMIDLFSYDPARVAEKWKGPVPDCSGRSRHAGSPS
jgi:hypothetical protein